MRYIKYSYDLARRCPLQAVRIESATILDEAEPSHEEVLEHYLTAFHKVDLEVRLVPLVLHMVEVDATAGQEVSSELPVARHTLELADCPQGEERQGSMEPQLLGL